MLLRNRVAIITGGSSGIGKAVVLLLAKNGAKVAVVSNVGKDIKSAVSEVNRSGGRAIGIRADVSKAKDVEKAVAQVRKVYKQIDILVNAAGIQEPIGPFLKNSLRDWTKNLEVNLLGTVMMTKEVLPLMLKNREGKIINFSGGGATGSRLNFSAYAVAKTGVVKFTEILADEVKNYGVQVNAIAPGAVNTNMLQEVLRAGRRAGDSELNAARERFKKGGTPVEVPAELILFLASEKSDGLTGRLISAPWDDWKNWDKKKIKEIMKTDRYKLRRLT